MNSIEAYTLLRNAAAVCDDRGDDMEDSVGERQWALLLPRLLQACTVATPWRTQYGSVDRRSINTACGLPGEELGGGSPTGGG